MALKEITFTKWNKERSFNDEMEFVILAKADHSHEFRDYYSKIISERLAKPIYQYSSTSIPGFPNAAVISFYKEAHHPEKGAVSGPDGQYDRVEDYVREVNDLLRKLWEDGVLHDAPYFYLTDKNGPGKTVMSYWNYPAGYRRKIFVFPILSLRNRRLLGMHPNYQEAPFIRMLQRTSPTPNHFPDVEIGEDGFHQKDDNMFVLCDLVRTTGMQAGIEGSILRVIPNRQEPQGTVVSHDFSEDYYEVTPKSSFFTVELRIVSSRDYRELNLVHPTTFTLHFKPMDRCTPAAAKKVLV